MGLRPQAPLGPFRSLPRDTCGPWRAPRGVPVAHRAPSCRWGPPKRRRYSRCCRMWSPREAAAIDSASRTCSMAVHAPTCRSGASLSMRAFASLAVLRRPTVRRSSDTSFSRMASFKCSRACRMASVARPIAASVASACSRRLSAKDPTWAAPSPPEAPPCSLAGNPSHASEASLRGRRSRSRC